MVRADRFRSLRSSDAPLAPARTDESGLHLGDRALNATRFEHYRVPSMTSVVRGDVVSLSTHGVRSLHWAPKSLPDLRFPRARHRF